MKKHVLILLTVILTLSAACLPWIETKDNEDDSSQTISDIRLLFYDLTNTEFIQYLIENAAFTKNGNSLEGSLEMK